MYAYEVKFIAYNKEKTQKTLLMKSLVYAPSPTKAKNKVIEVVKESQDWLVDIKSCKNLNYKAILFTK